MICNIGPNMIVEINAESPLLYFQRVLLVFHLGFHCNNRNHPHLNQIKPFLFFSVSLDHLGDAVRLPNSRFRQQRGQHHEAVVSHGALQLQPWLLQRRGLHRSCFGIIDEFRYKNKFFSIVL